MHGRGRCAEEIAVPFRLSKVVLGWNAGPFGPRSLGAKVDEYTRKRAGVLAKFEGLSGLIRAFAIGAFVVHNYVNLNIGLTITMQQSVAYFLEWVTTGIVIGLIYRPLR